MSAHYGPASSGSESLGQVGASVQYGLRIDAAVAETAAVASTVAVAVAAAVMQAESWSPEWCAVEAVMLW